MIDAGLIDEVRQLLDGGIDLIFASVNEDHPLSGDVLIVDDTFTTGATLSACYFAVREALGPSVRISIATLAVVEA